MNQDVTGSWIGTTLMAIFAGVTADFIVTILAIISGCISIAFTVWRWYRSAKADGKITKEEIDELIDDISEDAKDVVEKIDEIKDKDEK